MLNTFIKLEGFKVWVKLLASDVRDRYNLCQTPKLEQIH